MTDKHSGSTCHGQRVFPKANTVKFFIIAGVPGSLQGLEYLNTQHGVADSVKSEQDDGLAQRGRAATDTHISASGQSDNTTGKRRVRFDKTYHFIGLSVATNGYLQQPGSNGGQSGQTTELLYNKLNFFAL